MRHPEDIITPDGSSLRTVLSNHAAWLAGVGGERADLFRADLTGADLTGANLTRAKFPRAKLSRANLINADLTGANLTDARLFSAIFSRANLTRAKSPRAKLSRANLTGANLTGADLFRADLTGANLTGANLTGANLTGANLTGANLLAYGNMRELRTMQFDMWQIGYTADTLQIGYQKHPIATWRKWDTEAGRRWIDRMDGQALKWAERNLGLVLALIDANPATPTGHEGGDDD